MKKFAKLLVVLGILAYVGLICFAFIRLGWGTASLLTLLSLPFMYVILGFRMVPEERRYIIERFGGFSRVVGPKLIWFAPFIERVRFKPPVKTVQLQLFKDKKIKIDFTDGSAAPKDAFVFIECLDSNDKGFGGAVYRMGYGVDNLSVAVITLIENAVRSYLGTLSLGDALQEGRAGLDVMKQLQKTKKKPLKDQYNGVLKQLEDGWGLKLIRVTIGDFDLDERVIKAREAVTIAKMDLEASEKEATRRTNETIGVVLEMEARAQGIDVKVLQVQLRTDVAARERLLAKAQDLVERRIALSGGALTDVRVQGAQGIEHAILNILGVSRGLGSRVPAPSSGGTIPLSRGGGIQTAEVEEEEEDEEPENEGDIR